MIRKIVLDDTQLRHECEPCKSVAEGEEIAKDLLETLTASGNGIGLAANQVGINKRVCVVNVTEPLVFINPRIKSSEQDIVGVPEGCLSYPNKVAKTKRFKFITVEADNWEEPMVFGPTSDDEEKAQDEFMEAVCIQHEIDHLDGITMFDRVYKPEPIVRGKNAPLKIGRNVKIEITNGTETKNVKWKKAEPMLSEGWSVVEESLNV
jgi:peptide deformylase